MNIQNRHVPINTILLSIKNLYNGDLFPVVSVGYFVFVWLTLGNLVSVLYNLGIPAFKNQYNICYLIIYSSSILLVFLSLIKELSHLKSKTIKLIITFQLLLFLPFIYAPPRNADAMRVWLAKISDIILNGQIINRPYAHYHTPDAFTLFHLPLIQIGDGQIFQLSIFTCFVSILIIIINICKYYDHKYLTSSCLLLFIFNPLITLGATVILSDMPIILAVSGLIFSMLLFTREPKIGLLFSFLFFTFGLNIKYNMLMFVPVYFFWLVYNFKNSYKSINFIFLLFFFFLLIQGIYPYAKNYLIIGNPVWPAFNNFFHSNFPSWDIAAKNLTHGFLQDKHSLYNFLFSLINLILLPQHINPLVVLLMVFVFQRFKNVSFMPSFFVISKSDSVCFQL